MRCIPILEQLFVFVSIEFHESCVNSVISVNSASTVMLGVNLPLTRSKDPSLLFFGVNGKRFCTVMCVLCVELHMNDPPLSGLRLLNGNPKKPQICYKSKFLCVKKRTGDLASPVFDVFFSVLYALLSFMFSSSSPCVTMTVRFILLCK